MEREIGKQNKCKQMRRQENKEKQQEVVTMTNVCHIYNIDDIPTSRKVNIIHGNIRNMMSIITFPLKNKRRMNLKEE